MKSLDCTRPVQHLDSSFMTPCCYDRRSIQVNIILLEHSWQSRCYVDWSMCCMPFSTDGTFPDVPDGSWVDVAFMFSRIFQPSSPQCILNELWTREVFLDRAHIQLFIIWQSFNLRLWMDGELWSHWFLEVFLSPCSDLKASYLFVKQCRPRAWRSQAWILSFSFFQ